MAVNHGPWRAVRIPQEVLGLAGCRVDADGVLGSKTRCAAYEAQPEMEPFLADAVTGQRANFYRRLVAADASQRVYLRGWLRRAEVFKVDLLIQTGLTGWRA